MQIQAFCLPTIFASESRFLSEQDPFTKSYCEQPDSMLIHAESRGALLNMRAKTIYGHNIRFVHQFTSTSLHLLFHPAFIDIMEKLGEICKVNTEIFYEPTPELHFIGHVVSVELAQVQLYVLFDYLNEIPISSLEIPLYIQYSVAGKGLVNIENIMKKTNTTIRLQPSLSHTFGTLAEPFDTGTVYITGDQNDIALAKACLENLIREKSCDLSIVEINVDTSKIDWLLMNRRDAIHKIMVSNGSFILFPGLCLQNEKIKIFAQDTSGLERTIYMLNQEVCDIHEVTISFEFNEIKEDGDYNTLRFRFFDKMYDILSQISYLTQAELTYKSDINKLSILGTQEHIKNAACKLTEIDYLVDEILLVVFSLEFPNEEKEFITGKGKGKIKNIKARCDVSMRFQSYSEHNMHLKIESPSLSKATNGYLMILQELPAELSFYIPESQHRRIIGTGGKNIQRIMKEYCVYVKFISFDKKQASSNDQKCWENVIARTPMKNFVNLSRLKEILLSESKPKKSVVKKNTQKVSQKKLLFTGIELNNADMEMCLRKGSFFENLKKSIEKHEKVVIHEHLKQASGMMNHVHLIRGYEEKKRVLVYVIEYEENHIQEALEAKETIGEALIANGFEFVELGMKIRNILSFLETSFEF